MTSEQLLTKLYEESEKWLIDEDSFAGSEGEFQYATGKSEAYAEAAHMVLTFFTQKDTIPVTVAPSEST